MRNSQTSEYKRVRSKEELEQHLGQQLDYLDRSAEWFDQGHVSEAGRLATIVHLLCHDGSANNSLLRLLGMRGKMQFYDSAQRGPCDDGGYSANPPLLGYYVQENWQGYRALLTESHRGTWQKFSKWWEGIVYRIPKKPPVTRRQLIFQLRSQDGGSHVDPSITDESYDLMSRESKQLIPLSDDGSKWITLDHDASEQIHLHTVRQIAWELKHSIYQYRSLMI
jgi:hypothetical protein